jgi:hypothetical protein
VLQVALRGFILSDVYQLYTPERQHQSDIGISKGLLAYLSEFIKEHMMIGRQSSFLIGRQSS